MKKILSLLLAAVMLVSAVPTAFAADAPSTMLYNGVEITDINAVWTDELQVEYPYAVIETNAEQSYFVLIVTNKETRLAKNGSTFALVAIEDTQYKTWSIDIGRNCDGTCWCSYSDGTKDAISDKSLGTFGCVLWSNYDLLDYDNGTLAFESSAPVSVGGVAADTNDHTQGTQVVYEATGAESYTITVPALLAPGGSGTVTLAGTWADNRIVTVTADPDVTLTNSILATDTKTLKVNFNGISESGNNTEAQTFTAPVSVDPIADALFGTWSGKFNYNVDIVTATKLQSAPEEYMLTLESSDGLSWSDVVNAAQAIGINSLNVQYLSNFLILNEDEFTSDDYAAFIDTLYMINNEIMADYSYTYLNKPAKDLTDEERYILYNALDDEALNSIFDTVINLGNKYRFTVEFDTDVEGYPVCYLSMRH